MNAQYLLRGRIHKHSLRLTSVLLGSYEILSNSHILAKSARSPFLLSFLEFRLCFTAFCVVSLSAGTGGETYDDGPLEGVYNEDNRAEGPTFEISSLQSKVVLAS